MSSSSSPIRQGMSAAFSPEAERLRQAGKEKAEHAASAKGFSLNKSNLSQNKLSEGSKSQDSLGNPNTPGYDNIWSREKKEESQKENSDPNLISIRDESSQNIPGSQGKKRIRLQSGWEQILLVQQKICEKAKGIMTLIESPIKYSISRRGKLLMRRHQGCIVDLDIEEHRKEEARKRQIEKEEKEAA